MANNSPLNSSAAGIPLALSRNLALLWFRTIVTDLRKILKRRLLTTSCVGHTNLVACCHSAIEVGRIRVYGAMRIFYDVCLSAIDCM